MIETIPVTTWEITFAGPSWLPSRDRYGLGGLAQSKMTDWPRKLLVQASTADEALLVANEYVREISADHRVVGMEMVSNRGITQMTKESK